VRRPNGTPERSPVDLTSRLNLGSYLRIGHLEVSAEAIRQLSLPWGAALRFEDLRRANAASSSGLLFQQLADEVGGVEDATMKLPLRILAVAVGSDYIFNR
jgi:hypothetical protein